MIRVELVRAWPERHERAEVELPEGATAADALRAAGWSLGKGEALGAYGRRFGTGEILRDGERLEVLRPLALDPREARRRRVRRG